MASRTQLGIKLASAEVNTRPEDRCGLLPDMFGNGGTTSVIVWDSKTNEWQAITGNDKFFVFFVFLVFPIV